MRVSGKKSTDPLTVIYVMRGLVVDVCYIRFMHSVVVTPAPEDVSSPVRRALRKLVYLNFNRCTCSSEQQPLKTVGKTEF